MEMLEGAPQKCSCHIIRQRTVLNTIPQVQGPGQFLVSVVTSPALAIATVSQD